MPPLMLPLLPLGMLLSGAQLTVAERSLGLLLAMLPAPAAEASLRAVFLQLSRRLAVPELPADIEPALLPDMVWLPDMELP